MSQSTKNEERVAEGGSGIEASEPPNFHKVQVEIQTKEGPMLVDGLAHPYCPGLAITMLHFGTFDVTHIPTGRTASKGYERMNSAALALVELAHVADWSLDSEALKASLIEHGGESAGIERCTSTTMGVKRLMTKREIYESVRGHMSLDEFPWEGDDSPGHYVDELLDAMHARRVSSPAGDLAGNQP